MCDSITYFKVYYNNIQVLLKNKKNKKKFFKPGAVTILVNNQATLETLGSRSVHEALIITGYGEVRDRYMVIFTCRHGWTQKVFFFQTMPPFDYKKQI